MRVTWTFMIFISLFASFAWAQRSELAQSSGAVSALVDPGLRQMKIVKTPLEWGCQEALNQTGEFVPHYRKEIYDFENPDFRSEAREDRNIEYLVMRFQGKYRADEYGRKFGVESSMARLAAVRAERLGKTVHALCECKAFEPVREAAIKGLKDLETFLKSQGQQRALGCDPRTS